MQPTLNIPIKTKRPRGTSGAPSVYASKFAELVSILLKTGRIEADMRHYAENVRRLLLLLIDQTEGISYEENTNQQNVFTFWLDK